jgi:hypothetical protein
MVGLNKGSGMGSGLRACPENQDGQLSFETKKRTRKAKNQDGLFQL